APQLARARAPHPRRSPGGAPDLPEPAGRAAEPHRQPAPRPGARQARFLALLAAALSRGASGGFERAHRGGACHRLRDRSRAAESVDCAAAPRRLPDAAAGSAGERAMGIPTGSTEATETTEAADAGALLPPADVLARLASPALLVHLDVA